MASRRSAKGGFTSYKNSMRTEHWRVYTELEQLVPQALESLRRQGWPDPDRMFKVGPFNVRRAGWVIGTNYVQGGENFYGISEGGSRPDCWLLSDGRIVSRAEGDKARRAVKLSWFRKPNRCCADGLKEVLASLRQIAGV